MRTKEGHVYPVGISIMWTSGENVTCGQVEETQIRAGKRVNDWNRMMSERKRVNDWNRMMSERKRVTDRKSSE
ncbi:hypothetical protein SUGI_1127020 [Cryptomeria japonica]|nr:hypothetical protein SUGI_1127020 [Cryptomeria japonica]